MRSLAFLSLALCGACVPCCPDGYGQAPPGRYSWMPTTDPNQWALLDSARVPGVRQIGVFKMKEGVYKPFDHTANKWGQPNDPPSAAGLPPGGKLRLPPTGVIADKLHHSGSRITRGGAEISKDQALATLSGKPLVGGAAPTGTSEKKRINVIGSAEKCSAALAVAQKHKGDFDVADFRPDAWQITRQGFHVPADPTIYVQEPDGMVIRRLDGYEGDGAFEAVLTEIAKGHRVRPVDGYDQSKDAGWIDKIKPFLGQLSVPWGILGGAGVLGGLLILAVWSRRAKA